MAVRPARNVQAPAAVKDDDDEQYIVTPTGMRIRYIEVSPETAATWLTFNTRNRNMRGSALAQWTEEMKRGEWNEDIAPIAFHGFLDDGRKEAAECTCGMDTHPILLNGQHRLQACVQSGQPIWWLVWEGLTLQSQTDMDTGARRKLDDQLRLRGITSSTSIASIMRLCYVWEHQELRARKVMGTSYSTLLRWFDDNPNIVEVLPPARRLWNTVGGRESVWGAARWILLQLDHPQIEEDVDTFYELILSGENQQAGDPTFALRNLMLATRANPTRRRINQLQLLALIFKAWNYWQDGTQIQVLQWRGGGPKPEPFPIPTIES